MNLDNVFKKTKSRVGKKSPIKINRVKPEVPKGLVKKCNKCGKAIITEEVKLGGYICPKCGGYFRLPAKRRIAMIADPGSFEEWDTGLEISQQSEFPGYQEKIRLLRQKTKLDDAIVTGKIEINHRKAVVGVCDGRFLMASMGMVVGEKIARAVERATKEKLPIIFFACSGGARMQEGIHSLMQMSKTAAALKRHSDAGLLYITVLTDPTTGGVTASFAMLGDIILAEPKALIGFAGPRVIEQTIGQKLPKGFQRSEFLLEHGFIDAIVERNDIRGTLSQILKLHEEDSHFLQGGAEMPKVHTLEKKTKPCTAWERVEKSRNKDRPVASDYISSLFSDFMEFHGDRYYADDPAIIGGIAEFHGCPVTVIAQAKGTNTKENIRRNFGMPLPEGYRKAMRLEEQAEKFHRPILCFVDTPGAFCGLEAEERGQGEAIARNLYEMSGLKVPILSIIIGEGGSGGALALATANEVWMLENSVYSILSPEGFSSILWKDSKKAKEAAELMKLTAGDLKRQGIIEEIFQEPEKYTVDTMSDVVEAMDQKIVQFLKTYSAMREDQIVEQRYQRFRKM